MQRQRQLCTNAREEGRAGLHVTGAGATVRVAGANSRLSGPVGPLVGLERAAQPEAERPPPRPGRGRGPDARVEVPGPWRWRALNIYGNLERIFLARASLAIALSARKGAGRTRRGIVPPDTGHFSDGAIHT